MFERRDKPSRLDIPFIRIDKLAYLADRLSAIQAHADNKQEMVILCRV